LQPAQGDSNKRKRELLAGKVLIAHRDTKKGGD
jgi:hypothetical protein